MNLFPQAAWKTELTDTDTTPQEQLGLVRSEVTADGGTKLYKYVQNKSGGALAVGSAATYTLTDDSGYQVTTIAGADAGSGAGITLAASLADDSYGWIQIAGVNTAALVKGDTDPTTAGALVGTSATAAKLGGGTGFGTSYAQDTVSADSTGTVFLRGLL